MSHQTTGQQVFRISLHFQALRGCCTQRRCIISIALHFIRNTSFHCFQESQLRVLSTQESFVPGTALQIGWKPHCWHINNRGPNWQQLIPQIAGLKINKTEEHTDRDHFITPLSQHNYSYFLKRINCKDIYFKKLASQRTRKICLDAQQKINTNDDTNTDRLNLSRPEYRSSTRTELPTDVWNVSGTSQGATTTKWNFPPVQNYVLLLLDCFTEYWQTVFKITAVLISYNLSRRVKGLDRSVYSLILYYVLNTMFYEIA